VIKNKQKRPRFKQTATHNLVNESLIVKSILGNLPLRTVDAVLEIGCGEAPDLTYFVENLKMPNYLVGLDVSLSSNWRLLASRYKNLNFLVASGQFLPFKDHSFDFVFLRDVLHHVAHNHRAIIDEAIRILRSKGTLRVIEANRYHVNPILVMKSDQSHAHFTLKQLRQFKAAWSFEHLSGFEILPSFSSQISDLIWNLYVFVFWCLMTGYVGIQFASFFIRTKELLLGENLTYYVLSKRKGLQRESQ
jgi:ubiquinone/menaquinone biosynthesis C-methylase UbiE